MTSEGYRSRPCLTAAALVLALLLGAGEVGGAEIRIGSTNTTIGGTASFTVQLISGGDQVTAAQNDIQFDAGAMIAARAETVTVLADDIDANALDVPVFDASLLPDFGTVLIDSEVITYSGKNGDALIVAERGSRGTTAAPHSFGALVAVTRPIPDCAATDALRALSKSAVFSFLPAGCTLGTDCTAVRAAVLALDNLESLPESTPLYTCNVTAGPTAGSYPLGCALPRATDFFASVLSTSCVAGAVNVSSCLGDQNFSGFIDAGEATRAIVALTSRNVTFNPEADGDFDGSVSPAEAIRVALNFVLGTCASVGTSEQEATVGLGLGIGLPTQLVAIPVTYQGDAQSIAAFSFDVPYGSSEPYQWVADELGQVECFTEPAFSEVLLVGQVLDERVAFTVIDNVPPNALGAVGVVGHCRIRINDDTFSNFPLPCASGSGSASDLNGAEVSSVTCEDGMVMVATPPATPTPTPTPLPALVTVDQMVEGGAGEIVDVGARLTNNGNLVAGVQVDIEFPAAVSVADRGDGRPDCNVNPDIDKEGTSFAYRPLFCTPGVDCEAVRALVLSLSNVDPIPDGLLFTCRFRIPADAEIDTIYPLFVTNRGASDPSGFSLPLAGAAGSILVGEGSAATPTPTATLTATLEHTPTLTPAPTGTRTALVTPTVTPLETGCAGDCDLDGSVDVTDLITGISIGQGRIAPASCPSYDATADGFIDIAELLVAVQNSRDGCP